MDFDFHLSLGPFQMSRRLGEKKRMWHGQHNLVDKIQEHAVVVATVKVGSFRNIVA